MSAETLRRSARRSAEWRGHALGRFTRTGRTSWSAVCPCGAGVTVDTHPPANGIDIGGRAVAVDHPAAESRRWGSTTGTHGLPPGWSA